MTFAHDFSDRGSGMSGYLRMNALGKYDFVFTDPVEFDSETNQTQTDDSPAQLTIKVGGRPIPSRTPGGGVSGFHLLTWTRTRSNRQPGRLYDRRRRRRGAGRRGSAAGERPESTLPTTPTGRWSLFRRSALRTARTVRGTGGEGDRALGRDARGVQRDERRRSSPAERRGRQPHGALRVRRPRGLDRARSPRRAIR